MRSMLRALSDGHGGDQQMQLMRQFLDSASALAYFLEAPGDESRIKAYLCDSLITEREFLANVAQQIKARGGQKLPIEERIERSIARTLDRAGVKVEEIPARGKIGWPNAEQRLALLGPTAYSAYRTGSSGIHGAWNDLERNHLEYRDSSFVPLYDAADPRPQPMLAMALLCVSIAKNYVEKRFPELASSYSARAERYLEKLREVDKQHEEYLSQLPDQGAEGE